MPQPLNLSSSRVLLPKSGCPQRECEDALAANHGALRFAVADGATEAFDSRRWARYLCHAWVALGTGEPSDDDYLRGLSELSERFKGHHRTPGVPWFVEAKAEQGSFATFLGLELRPATATRGMWAAMAVGDCCLFEFDGNQVASSFPLTTPEAFGTHPDAVPTNTDLLRALRPVVHRTAGFYAPGAALMLTTDAVAQWLLRELVSDATVGQRFREAVRGGVDAVRSVVDDARNQGLMRNDDVGILLVELAEDSASTMATQ